MDLRKIGYFFFIFLLSFSLLYADTSDTPNTKDFIESVSKSIQKHTLKNGVRVILMKNGSAPTISAYIKFAVGSSNEPFDLSGTAHLLEHMLFKGTDKLGTLDFDKEKIYLEQINYDGEKIDKLKTQLQDPSLSIEKKIKKQNLIRKLEERQKFLQDYSSRFILSEEYSEAYALAGQRGFNAYTSVDVTNYEIRLPKNRLELWAYLESSRILNPVFREFYSERKVVMQEKRMRYDSRPTAQLFQLFLSTAFGFSPYGKPVIGYESNIPVLTLENTKKFFYENYIPSRMVITLVGDIDCDKTLTLVKKYFEKIPTKPLPTFPPILQETQKGKRIAYLETSLRASPALITGWSKPSIFSKDHATFEVLEKILTAGQTSRLVKRLVIDEKLASGVYSYNGIPGHRLNNNFTVWIETYKEEDYQRAEKILKEELQKLAQEGPGEKELQKVKNNYLAYLINSIESNDGLANSLSYYEAVKNDYSEFFRNIEHLQKVTKEDIQELIKNYLLDKNNTTVYLKKIIE